MTFNLELIDELRKRANVSYEEAKEALEKCNGDLLEAMIYLEKQNKVRSEEGKHCENTFFTKIKNLIKKGNRTKFIIRKKDNVILKLSVTLSVLITVIAPHLTLIALIIALITGHRLKFEGPSGENMKVNETLDKVSDAVDNAKKKLTEDDLTENTKTN